MLPFTFLKRFLPIYFIDMHTSASCGMLKVDSRLRWKGLESTPQVTVHSACDFATTAKRYPARQRSPPQHRTA